MPKPDAAATLPRALVLPLPAWCLAALVAGVAPALMASTDSDCVERGQPLVTLSSVELAGGLGRPGGRRAGVRASGQDQG